MTTKEQPQCPIFFMESSEIRGSAMLCRIASDTFISIPEQLEAFVELCELLFVGEITMTENLKRRLILQNTKWVSLAAIL
jgi:hypothetical protein